MNKESIATLATPEIDDAEDIGTQVNNHRLVEALRAALLSGKRASTYVPGLMEEVIEEEAWRRRLDANGSTFRPADFIAFIEGDEPVGLGKDLDDVRRYLGDSGNPLRVKFETLVDQGRGNPIGRIDVMRADDGTFSSIPNNIRDTGEDEKPASIPIPGRIRDRSTEPQAGTSIGYTVRRLTREAKGDTAIAAVLGRLERGEISANAAAVLAGHRPKSITIPADPRAAARRLVRHFTADEFNVLVATALDLYGVPEAVGESTGLRPSETTRATKRKGDSDG